MFVNARSRVYRISESKKKLKVGAEAEKQKLSSVSGDREVTRSLTVLLSVCALRRLLKVACVCMCFQR